MAILSKGSTTTTTTKDGKTDEVKEKAVDLSDSSLKAGKKSKLDPTEDAWTYSAPPPKGKYDLKIFLSKDAFSQGFSDPQDEDTVYYKANLECKVVSDDKDVDGYTVFGNVSTKIGRGKNISTMAGLIVKMGFKIPEEASPLDIAKMFKKALGTEPILRDCLLDWQGWSKNDQKVILTSMDDFPEDEEGNPRHKVTITNKDGGREEINASIKVKEWGNKKKGNTAEGGAKTVKKTEVEIPEEDKPEAKPKAKATGKGKVKEEPKPEPEVVEETEGEGEEEEELLLEEE